MAELKNNENVLRALDRLPRRSLNRRQSFVATEPMPLIRDADAPQPFPLECIGTTMAAAVQVIADVVKAPLEIWAQSALEAASLISQGLYDVKIDGRQSPSSCFFLTIAA